MAGHDCRRGGRIGGRRILRHFARGFVPPNVRRTCAKSRDAAHNGGKTTAMACGCEDVKNPCGAESKVKGRGVRPFCNQVLAAFAFLLSLPCSFESSAEPFRQNAFSFSSVIPEISLCTRRRHCASSQRRRIFLSHRSPRAAC